MECNTESLGATWRALSLTVTPRRCWVRCPSALHASLARGGGQKRRGVNCDVGMAASTGHRSTGVFSISKILNSGLWYCYSLVSLIFQTRPFPIFNPSGESQVFDHYFYCTLFFSPGFSFRIYYLLKSTKNFNIY